jgi:hypothetical protein
MADFSPDTYLPRDYEYVLQGRTRASQMLDPGYIDDDLGQQIAYGLATLARSTYELRKNNANNASGEAPAKHETTKTVANAFQLEAFNYALTDVDLMICTNIAALDTADAIIYKLGEVKHKKDEMKEAITSRARFAASSILKASDAVFKPIPEIGPHSLWDVANTDRKEYGMKFPKISDETWFDFMTLRNKAIKAPLHRTKIPSFEPSNNHYLTIMRAAALRRKEIYIAKSGKIDLANYRKKLADSTLSGFNESLALSYSQILLVENVATYMSQRLYLSQKRHNIIDLNPSFGKFQFLMHRLIPSLKIVDERVAYDGKVDDALRQIEMHSNRG